MGALSMVAPSNAGLDIPAADLSGCAITNRTHMTHHPPFIGMITYHSCANYGAFLQAFAQQAFWDNEGCKSEFIHYVPRTHRPPLIHSLVGRTVANTFRNWRRLGHEVTFRRFRKRLLRVSGPAMTTWEQVRNQSHAYDVMTTGSDQVWNPQWRHGAGVIAYPYFLDFGRPDAIRASVAASFGTASVPVESEPELRRCLQRFAAISVREATGKDIVQGQLGLSCEVVPDPVFLHGPEQWRRYRRSCGSTGHIFAYFVQGPTPRFSSNVLACLRALDTPILSPAISHLPRVTPADKTLFLDPWQWIDAIDRASLVVTNSFHALAFCVLLDKPFVLFGRGGPDSGMNTRLDTIRTRIGHQLPVHHHDEPDVAEFWDAVRQARGFGAAQAELQSDITAFLKALVA
jgi:hypothetical protein